MDTKSRFVGHNAVLILPDGIGVDTREFDAAAAEVKRSLADVGHVLGSALVSSIQELSRSFEIALMVELCQDYRLPVRGGLRSPHTGRLYKRRVQKKKLKALGLW